MASNSHTIADEDGDYEDWVELINFGSETVDLEGYGLSDDYENPFRWIFPDVAIEPGGFLLIWASGKDRRPEGGWINALMREVYEDIPGSSIDNLINHPSYPDNPSHRHFITNGFEAPVNVGDHYGQRIHGYLEPPVSGNYVFWISSDDNGRLYLSTDNDPENINEIASVPGWTNSREWNKYPEQQSDPVYLEAGNRYYIKALMKEHAGGDNLAVRWMLPSGDIEEPLPAERLFWEETVLHTNFKISREGEEILLTNTDSIRVDEIAPTEMLTDISYGRSPDGTGNFFFFLNPTPGDPNDENGLEQLPVLPDPPLFSIKGGPYRSEFMLGFEFDQGLEVYYTTDGSLPVPGTANLYSEPFPVSETVLVRAITHVPGEASSIVAGEVYTRLSESIAEFSSDLPVMVMHQFDRSVTAGGRTPAYISLFEPDNEGRSGPGSDPVLQGRVMVNIRGSSSQGFPKKMFGFHIVEEDGSSRKEELLGMPEEHNWILNGPYSDKSLMRNVIAYSLSNDIGRYSPRTRYIELFMHQGNGTLRESHYHGVYVLTERIKWADGRVEIQIIDDNDNEEPEITGGYIIKKDRFNPGESGLRTQRGTNLAFVRPNESDITPGQKAWIENYLSMFETALFGPGFTDPSDGYAKYIDQDSFIDAHLITELLKEIDGYRLSTFMHKDRNEKLVMGPLWDFNLSLGNANYNEGWKPEGWYFSLINQSQYLDGWYSRLFADPEFTERYRERWWQLRRGQFSDDSLTARINQNAARLNEAQERNYERWPVLNTYIWPNWYIAPTFEAEIEWMTGWLTDRADWMDSQLGKPSALIHLWHFNDLPSGDLGDVTADYSETGASLTWASGGTADRVNDGTLLNADLGKPAGRALRVRNPSDDGELIFSLPTTGYRDVVLKYMAKRTANGARQQTVYYRVSDVSDWILFSDTLEITETYRQFRFSFRGIKETYNNPGFSVRILFHGEEAAGLSGNNRFDNITLEGSKGIKYYSKSSGELTNPDTWGTEPDGGGEQPASFGLNSAYFHIVNRNLVILDSDWEVTGTGSKVVVGDGENSTKLEVHSQLDAVVDVTSNATLELANSSLPEINDLGTGSTVLFTGNATNIPYNSYFNLVIDNTDPVFNQPGELIIRGDLTLSGKVNMPDARGIQEYNLVFTGEHEQLITGNGNVVRGFNVVFDKPAGTVSFGTENGGTILSSDNQLTLLISQEASFDDNGITIYAGNSVNIDGDPDSFNFTGTLVLAGSEAGIVNGAGIGNNFNIRDSNNNSNAQATFNNLVIRAFNHNGEFRFRDGSGNILRVKGDLIVEAGAMGRIRFYENTLHIGGDLIIEEGFDGSVDEISTLVFDGERDQQLSVPYLISTGNLLINCAGNLRLHGELLVKNSISFESGMLDVLQNSLPILGHQATISGYNEESHVKGPLGRYFRNTDPKEALFPVGKDGNYKPFAIETSHNNDNTVLYVVELNNEAPPELTVPAEIINVSQDFHFTLEIMGDYDIGRAYASIYHPSGQSENEGYLMSIVKSGDGEWINLGGEIVNGFVRAEAPFTSPGIFTTATRAGEVSITASAGEGGRIEPEGIQKISMVSETRYRIRSDNGYHIDNLYIDNEPLTDAKGSFVFDYTFRNPATDMTIHAEFAPNNYLDVTISPNPARETIRVEFMQNIEYVAVISLIDMKGVTLMERTLSPGDNTSGTLSIKGTEPGIYIISISYGQYRINKMVVII